MLAAVLLMIALSPFQLLATAEQQGVFTGAPIDADECQKDPKAVCAQLTFLYNNGTKIGSVHGTGDLNTVHGFEKKWWRGAGKVKVHQSGIGCYRIFKGKNQKGACQTLKDYNQQDATCVAMKSIKYDKTCKFRHSASVVVGVVVAVLLVVLLALLGVFAMKAYKRQQAQGVALTSPDP